MPFVLLLLAAVLLAAGMLTARGRTTGRRALIPQAGAVLVIAGAVLLAWFVFSGDPYVNGAASRWSRRDSHAFVYAAWAASAAVAAALWWEGGRRSSAARQAGLLAVGAAVAVLQAVAAVSQNLN
jgi:hypothetical protein